jgi:hypothetical protein
MSLPQVVVRGVEAGCGVGGGGGSVDGGEGDGEGYGHVEVGVGDGRVGVVVVVVVGYEAGSYVGDVSETVNQNVSLPLLLLSPLPPAQLHPKQQVKETD